MQKIAEASGNAEILPKTTFGRLKFNAGDW
jgi:hypothetical protein